MFHLCPEMQANETQCSLGIPSQSVIFILLHIERFSFECRKVIGFAFTTLRDWLKRFAPLFYPIRSKTKTNYVNYVIASHALRQLHVITSSFDWFTVLSVFFLVYSNENRSMTELCVFGDFLGKRTLCDAYHKKACISLTCNSGHIVYLCLNRV